MTPEDLRLLHQSCNRAWQGSGRDVSLSLNEFEYLSVIKEEEDRMRIQDSHGQHLQDIVSALCVAKASASAMIAKLEKRGLVQRFDCKQDARAQHIILTEQGLALMQKGLALYERLAREIPTDTRNATP